jgi:hypothetical protein
MADYRDRFPQMDSEMLLAGVGFEVPQSFNKGIELPHFVSANLLRSDRGRAALPRCFECCCGQ